MQYLSRAHGSYPAAEGACGGLGDLIRGEGSAHDTPSTSSVRGRNRVKLFPRARGPLVQSIKAALLLRRVSVAVWAT